MTKFDFRLENVLRFRQQQASVEENRLMAVRHELQRCEEELERIRLDRISNKQRLLSEPESLATLLAATDSYAEFLQVRERFAVVRVRDCQRKIDQQRLKVLEAQRQTKLFEALKQKAHTGWRREESREEDATASDTYVSAFLRRKRSGNSAAPSTAVSTEPHG